MVIVVDCQFKHVPNNGTTITTVSVSFMELLSHTEVLSCVNQAKSIIQDLRFIMFFKFNYAKYLSTYL